MEDAVEEQPPPSCSEDMVNCQIKKPLSPANSDSNLDETPRKRKSSKSEDEFLGFKKQCIDDATNYYKKFLTYSSISLLNETDLNVEGVEITDHSEDVKKILLDCSKNNKSEYAEYLGLQPALQFKCMNCSTSNFSTLTELNQHAKSCSTLSSENSDNQASASNHSNANFKITRRVYLCSACGVNFEIWKLFLHMRTAHKRYICLICLGLFSIAEKLSNHLVVKHNILPRNYDNVTHFLRDYTGQMFVMCCTCARMFTEQDDFVEHVCETVKDVTVNKTNDVSNSIGNKFNKHRKLYNKLSPTNGRTVGKVKNKILPSEHVTADTETDERGTESEQNHIDERVNEPDLEETKEEHLSTTNSVNMENNIENLIEPEENDLNTHPLSNTILTEEKLNVDDKDLNETNVMNNESPAHSDNPIQDERRVPKVTLKIPQNIKEVIESDSESSSSDDSFKLTMELDDNIVEKLDENQKNNTIADSDSNIKKEANESALHVADVNIPIIELGLRPPLDKVTIQSLLKDFIRATCYACIYCNYARKIAVNGKQLGLHIIAEHRFSATADSITGEELLPETFVRHIRENFQSLEEMYFNLESYDNTDPESMTPYDRTYECFQCRFVTTVHKELYLHNRKMHQKTLLLCIMCKSTFYSYSELLCHLCPGVYLGTDVSFRCCLCPLDNIPSAFRLMVHLRKRHHACDVCLETCINQSKLSNHVWKHKLHHFCYRCGISYRNKPDITRHLFWKHGTESVLCKKCLQKKWPHVYHFCIPPTNFTCEECAMSFTKAVALKVHKRLHSNTKPYTCTEENCTEKFISNKLLEKHISAHREPPVLLQSESLKSIEMTQNHEKETTIEHESMAQNESNQENVKSLEKPEIKKVVDVYDLPELNLSESDSDDSEDERPKTVTPNNENKSNEEPVKSNEEFPPTAPNEITEMDTTVVVDGIWDNFKNYQASIEKKEQPEVEEETNERNYLDLLLSAIMREHDYCVESNSENAPSAEAQPQETPAVDEPDNTINKEDLNKSSSDSSDSDSSSCSCGSNCSCSSSSSGSSSSSSSSSDSDSSSSESRRKNAERRQKHKERIRNRKKISETSTIEVVEPVTEIPIQPVELPIYESDLYTDESETDEDFYDKSPQLLANKFLQEKKNQLLLDVVGGSPLNGSLYENSRSSTPNLPEEQILKKKQKIKSKKRKKAPKVKSTPLNPMSQSPAPAVLPLKLNIPHAYLSPKTNHTEIKTMSPKVLTSPAVPITVTQSSNPGSGSETDSNLRLSKRRRVPNKFYGYSSDDDSSTAMPTIPPVFSKPPEPPKLEWNKEDLPSPPTNISSLPDKPPVWNKLPASIQNVQQPTVVTQTRDVTSQLVPMRSTTSSSSSEGADSDEERLHISQPEGHDTPPMPTSIVPPLLLQHSTAPPRPAENLYCYCQCPYDEVSEMIACDGKKCAIEWFHFECVGIMVPPKGKWFCPDCRKQTVHQRPEYFMSQ